MKKKNTLITLPLLLISVLFLTACSSEFFQPIGLNEKTEKQTKKTTTRKSQEETTTSTEDEDSPSEDDKVAKGLPDNASEAKTDKIYATGDAKVYYFRHDDGFEAQIPDFKGYTQEKVKEVLGDPQEIITDSAQIQTKMKENELSNLKDLLKKGDITENQAKAFYTGAVDLAAAAQLGTKYVLYSYEDGKVLLIFNTDDTKNLYYITPNPEYLYFK